MSKKLNISYSQCDCDKCSLMCRAPCCGTPNDLDRLIKEGYGNRLMLDDLPGGNDLLKPALKGYEGKKSPWAVASMEGCTFWKDGKCELHSLNLKPEQAKLVHCLSSDQELEEIANYIDESWASDEAQQVIKKWKSLYE